eukprot:m.44598 g.44598  ORF g.44598 m.44598 type:complete len:554 (-) comp8559_c0_seq1:2948-4609(-)
MWAARRSPEPGQGQAVVAVAVGLAVGVLLLLLCAKKAKKTRAPDRASTLVNSVSKHSATNPNVVWEDPLPIPEQQLATISDKSANGSSTRGSKPKDTTASPKKSQPNESKRSKKGKKTSSPPEEFGGFEGVGNGGVSPGADDMDEEAFDGFDTVAAEDEAAVPAWYAGKLSRDICEETVLAGSKGDFLVRESSRGDRCVICINIGGKVMNLLVVAKDGKYRFAGKDRNGLVEVVFFLRLKPLKLKSGPCKVAKPAKGLKEAQKRDRERSEQELLGFDTEQQQARERAASARRLEFTRGATQAPVPPVESDTDQAYAITADDLYDDATAMVDEFENEEPLYVDMYDANVPSAEWIAREEERHRLEVAGVQRLSNEAFGELRFKARERAETAARENRRLSQLAREKSVIRKAWKKSSGTLPKEPMVPVPEKKEENFFDYQNASLREFGGYDEDEIYDSVPAWFAGKLNRDTCDKAVLKGGSGTYLIRESSSGDKYIVCVNWEGVAKNFQVYITEDGGYKFSGQTYPDLQRLVTFLQKHGITKNGRSLTLGRVAQW